MKKFNRKILKILSYLLIAILIIFVLSSFIVNLGENYSWQQIYFSSEVLVAITVGIFGIWSWLFQKEDAEKDLEQSVFENDLQMLQSIDEIFDRYQNGKDGPKVLAEFQEVMDQLSEYFENNPGNRGIFLKRYYRYVNSKVQPSDYAEELDERDSFVENNNSIQDVKKKITTELDVPLKYIRYSKNYEDSARENHFQWTTWYSLRKSFVENVSDNTKVVFLTNVEGKYTGVSILGSKLKELSKEMKTRSKKNGDLQYDFYITLRKDGTYFENRNGISLENYGVEPIDFDFK